jgi:transcriptional regulator with XRE-family HTH domain
MNVTTDCVGAIVQTPLVQTTSLTDCLGGGPASAANAVLLALPPTSSPASERPLHHLGEVRRRERLTRRKVAQLLGISIGEVEQQEQPSSDMRLSELLRWQKALKVPIAELLNEPDGELSPPVQWRARLLRAMKTVRSIQEKTRQVSVRRLAETLVDLLLEVMPELEDTAAWPTVGQRRQQRDLGQAFFRKLALDSFEDAEPLEGYP